MTIPLRNSLSYIFIIIGLCCSAQRNIDYAFVQNLIIQKKNTQANYYLNYFKHSFSDDSLNFLRGYNYYLMKKPDSCSLSLIKINPSFVEWNKTQLLLSINLDYSSNINQAISTLNQIQNDTNPIINQIKYTLYAGNMLLLRNLTAYDTIVKKFDFNNIAYEKSQINLSELKIRILKHKEKSAIVAGMLSTIMPGLGKFYVGRKGEAMAAFSTNIIFAGMAAEAYYRTKSFKSPQFIIFTTLFSFFYSGNIIGSIYSAKKQNKSIKKQINNEILANMHIPIANLFD